MLEIGSVRLQTNYVVYLDGTRYVIEGQVRGDPGRRHTAIVSQRAVETVAELLLGGPASAQELAQAIEVLGLQEQGFQYRYGWQLQFEVQRALLVLVARGEVDVHKEGRRFIYSIRD